MANETKGRRLPIVEDFYSIQGEGFNSGKAAYFVRLAGCDVRCSWCDAKESWEVGNHPLRSVEWIVERVVASGARTVVVTGGEPMLHNLSELCEALHRINVEVFVETTGSRTLTANFDWVCISPKRQKAPIDSAMAKADELKVVVAESRDLEWAEECAARVGSQCKLYLQPEWSVTQSIMPTLVQYAKRHPQWRISIQTHKYMQIP
ncbi:MAG: 7-carboxy-7-deazaguanine synthase QueE [Rikenellaceae bacterium]